MKKKSLLFITFSLFYFTNIFAQGSLNFLYNESGNCIKKYLTVVLSPFGNDSISESNVSRTDNIGDMQITVYPNPTEGVLRVAIGGADDNSFLFTVIDMGGRVLQSFKSYNVETDVDMTSYLEGVYILKVVAGGKTSVFRIIKK